MKTLFNIGDKITAGDIASYIFDTIRPTAGYSLRKLSNISGPVIRARRSIDNKESDFYADEIEGGELQSFATGDGASDVFVTTWYDQFGNNNATQTSASNQPKIWDASTGLVTENGKPALDFDGTDDDFGISDFQTSAYVNIALFSVINATSTTGARNIFGKYDFANDERSFTTAVRDGEWSNNISQDGGVNVLRIDSSNNSPSGYNLFSNLWDLSKTNQIDRIDFYRNGVLASKTIETSNNITSAFNANTIFNIGSTQSVNFFKGIMQEIIFYDSDQSANRETIETNINQYYIIFGPLRYNQRVTEDSGTFALTDRYEAVYDEVTEIATPSLLCTCDAFKESTLATYGTLYNIIPS